MSVAAPEQDLNRYRGYASSRPGAGAYKFTLQPATPVSAPTPEPAPDLGKKLENTLADLKKELNSDKSPKAKADAALKVRNDQQDPKAKEAVTDFVLKNTQGADQAQFLTEMHKTDPSAVQVLVSQKEKVTLSGDVSSVGQDLAALPLKAMEIKGGTKLPDNLKLTGNQDGLKLANVTAHGLDVRDTTGKIDATGADVSGGAINAAADKKPAIGNAAKLMQAGAKTQYKPTDPNGGPLTLAQCGGTAGLEKAIHNGMMTASNPHSALNSTRAHAIMGIAHAPGAPGAAV